MSNLPTCYDPESMTFAEMRDALNTVYLNCYPWHGTPEARSYDYPTFEEAVKEWASDEFYIQYLTAKLYSDAMEWTK